MHLDKHQNKEAKRRQGEEMPMPKVVLHTSFSVSLVFKIELQAVVSE